MPDTLAPGTTVAFVGLGHMGMPMTGRLLAADYDVRGYDQSAATRQAYRSSTAATPPTPFSTPAGRAGVDPDGSRLRRGTRGADRRRRPRVLAGGSGRARHGLVRPSADEGARRQGRGPWTDPRGRPRLGRCRRRGERPSDDHGGRRSGCRRTLPAAARAARPRCRRGRRRRGARAQGAEQPALRDPPAGERGGRPRRDAFGLDPDTMLDAINGSTGRSYSTEFKLPRFVLPRPSTPGSPCG